MLAALLNTKTPSLCRVLEQSIKSGNGRGSRIKRPPLRFIVLGFGSWVSQALVALGAYQPRSPSLGSAAEVPCSSPNQSALVVLSPKQNQAAALRRLVVLAQAAQCSCLVPPLSATSKPAA